MIPPNPIGVTEYRIGCKPYQCNTRINTAEPRRGDRIIMLWCILSENPVGVTYYRIGC